MVPITWDKIGMKNLTKRSFFSTSTKTVPIKRYVSVDALLWLCDASEVVGAGSSQIDA